MNVLAPGKVVLSGEHAVLYGAPALVTAIDRYVSVNVKPAAEPNMILHALGQRLVLKRATLAQHRLQLLDRYKQFTQQQLPIQAVLNQPIDLLTFTIADCVEALNSALLDVEITVESTLLLGAGLGSSAAAILSLIKALYDAANVVLPAEKLYQQALLIENLRHGYSSGMDLKVSQQGGSLLLTKTTAQKKILPRLPFFLVNSGIPNSSTGECVMHAQPYFQSQACVQDFTEVTYAMDAAIAAMNFPDIRKAVMQNHELLTRIGVVPEKIQQFIAQIAAKGGAAKICGAGTISGESAGVLLVMLENEATLQACCAQWQYDYFPLIPDHRGLHAN